MDKDGLLHTGRTDLTPEQRVYAQPAQLAAHASHGAIGLADVIGRVEATILIGLSTVGGALHRADRPRDGPQGRAAGDLPALEPHDPFRSQPPKT